jgi:uncharacterized membrane protein YedE/YeeE
MREAVISLISGILFGAGLGLSGMLDPSRVRGFLNIFETWDPTLAFVMGGATLIMAFAWFLKSRLQAPIFSPHFDLPRNKVIDRRLIGGSILFGLGWGIAGLCPGPAIASFAINPSQAIVFTLAMAAGMAAFKVIDGYDMKKMVISTKT